MGNTGLLISATTLDEAHVVLHSGCGWLDLKNPLRGSLGRPSLELTRSFLELSVPKHTGLSIAGGELQDWNLELDRKFAAAVPLNAFLKIALAGCADLAWGRKAREISSHLQRPSQLILAYYADAQQVQCPIWHDVLQVSQSIGCKYILVDTCQKWSGRLLDHCTAEQLHAMIHSASKFGLRVALAGSIRLDEMELLANLGASWLGLRGAVCMESDRTQSICPRRLQQAIALFEPLSIRDASDYVLG
jgi:(5-formylfuran-3-yl)methyl phosphate synthase